MDGWVWESNFHAVSEELKRSEDLRSALSMLWTYYLLPISDEQTAQVKAALGEE